jgi:hypothetical protein
MNWLEKAVQEVVAIRLWITALYTLSGLMLGMAVGLMVHAVRLLRQEFRETEVE